MSAVPTGPTISQTPTDAVGHVAPDFDDRRHFNTLVLRPEFRISLRLGSFDALCPDDPVTVAGQQMRLQLLAYLYEPLKNKPAVDNAHAVVMQWFTGAAAPTGINQGLGKTVADLSTELESGIVEGGALPAPGALAKIWFPGGYCFNDADENEGLGGPVASPPTKHIKYRREEKVWKDNPTMGAIPIIAKVERRGPGAAEWVPAPNVMVYLQLRKPDPAAGTQLAPVSRAVVTANPAPAVASNPSTYVTTQITLPARVAPADDPQEDNCHSKVGGLRGKPAAGRVLELTMTGGGLRPGFYKAHTTGRAVPGKPPFFIPPETAPADNPHAIRAMSNENGEAGFIFRPSRTGGDRYKLRAYIGQPTLPSDGTDVAAVSVETGTFVVWRKIRISRYLVWDYPAGFAQPPVPPQPSNVWTMRQVMDFRITNMGVISLQTVADEYAKAYCEVVTEATAARTVMTAADWSAARAHALTRVTSPSVNLQQLLPANNATPHMLPFLDRASYNAARNVGGTFPAFPNNNATYWNAMSSLIESFINAFCHFFTREAMPFVVLQWPFGDSLTFSAAAPPNLGMSFLTTSGQATPHRGAHLWWGTDFYNSFAYPGGVSHNTVHESGHCHYGAHHWTGNGPPLSGGVPTDHDQHDFCVMGYLTCPGDFCGRCLLRLRGWDVAAIPAN